MKLSKNIIKIMAPALALSIMASCSDEFLKPEPLSFFEPEATFSTESGLQAAMAICDRHMRRHMMSENSNTIPMGTELLFSDMACYGKTDAGSGFQDDWAGNLTPTSWYASSFNDGAMVGWFWGNGYDHVKYANTVLDNIDNVETLSPAIKNEYKGRAYFHRAWAYYNLVFQYGNIPLVTSLPVGPKQDYRSCPMQEILKMCCENLKDAVEWVPSQSEMSLYGMINKEACRLLYAKCLLAIGDYNGAEIQCDELINNSGLSLMKESFGSFEETAAPKTWPITRNVIWDLHRPCNKILSANRELIMGMPNVSEQSFQSHPSMRVFGPFYVTNDQIKTPTDSKNNAIVRNSKTDANWRETTDWVRACGRGIGTFRATHWSQKGLWVVNGVEDEQDLRHNHEVGNWLRMEDMTYSNVDSKDWGKNLIREYPEDVVSKSGKLLHKKGDPLCTDTIRCWFDVPLYKMYYRSDTDDKNESSNEYQGATTGSNANFYLYRLAEAYLVRAEARLYQGRAGDAANDVNELRKRAKCSQLYNGSVNIGDIMDERARELYLEEFRHVELVRVSMCLAMTGIADEWGNTYDINTWDKQTGTDAAGGSYWYQRVYHHNYYNHGKIVSGGKEINYTMSKHMMFWPVSHDAIIGNKFVPLYQNFGYDGYDPNIPMWSTWQEADAASREM